MSQFIYNISNALKKIEMILSVIAGAALVVTMVLIVADVVMRYYFNQPLTWWYDVLTNYVMIAMFYLFFSEALRQNYHLSVDILQNRIPKNIMRKISGATYFFVGPLMVYIGYLGMKSAASSYAQKEVLAGLIAWPTWPTKMIAGLAFLILGLRGCLMILNNENHSSN